MTLRVVELFSGIGAQASALEKLGIDFTSTVCDIDEKAYIGYCAIHGPTTNLGDITKVEHLPDCDLVTYSSPCQDISVAGDKKGMVEGSGTRSSLLWEVGRLLEDMRERDALPEVLVMENVDAILNQSNIGEFRRWIAFLDKLGYHSAYKVMNAKDYGVPQNRKRCFMVSTRTLGQFVFPEGKPLDKRLKDILESNVPESYYLTEERIAKYERHKATQHAQGRGFGWDPRTPNQIATTTTNPTKDATSTVIVSELEVAGDLHLDGRFDIANRVHDPDGISPTIHCGQGGGTTPKIDVTDGDGQ